MADLGRASRGAGERSDRDRLAAEVDELGPFIELAREIKRNVDRIAADDAAGIDELSEAIEQVPRSERQRVTEAVFERLDPEVQWAILERAFGDDEVRQHLDRHRQGLEADIRRRGELGAIADGARSARLLDTRVVPIGAEVVVGLFREADVRPATARGHTSDSCARRLVLRAVSPGRFRVIEDVFNPRGGLFVTREYDEITWEVDRFASHALIEVGAALEDAEGPAFEPVVYLGGRADFRSESGVIRGRLHTGFVMLGDIDVFAD